MDATTEARETPGADVTVPPAVDEYQGTPGRRRMLELVRLEEERKRRRPRG